MTGPPRIPTALKELAGNPGNRPLNGAEPKPEAKAPPMPRGVLMPLAQKFWRDHAPALERLGILTEIDGATFAMMATHYALALEAAKILKQEGLLRKDENGVDRKHPMLQILRDSSNAYRQYAAQFGLTPSARSRLSIPEPEGGDDFFGF